MWRWFHFNFELKAVDEADSSYETIDATEANKADEAFDAKANEVEVVIIPAKAVEADAKAHEADAEVNEANKAIVAD
jgi:hypothetical protein